MQNILDTMNAGRQAKMQALEEAIADEKAVEGVYACRDQIYDILKVPLNVFFTSYLHFACLTCVTVC